jgi:hypothetical protein
LTGLIREPFREASLPDATQDLSKFSQGSFLVAVSLDCHVHLVLVSLESLWVAQDSTLIQLVLVRTFQLDLHEVRGRMSHWRVN